MLDRSYVLLSSPPVKPISEPIPDQSPLVKPQRIEEVTYESPALPLSCSAAVELKLTERDGRRQPLAPTAHDYRTAHYWALAGWIYPRYTGSVAKVLISLPDDLLQRIDREARARGSNRSRFLQEAARRQLGWPAAEVLDAALKRGREALVGVGSFESAELIREQRLARDADDRRR